MEAGLLIKESSAYAPDFEEDKRTQRGRVDLQSPRSGIYVLTWSLDIIFLVGGRSGSTLQEGYINQFRRVALPNMTIRYSSDLQDIIASQNVESGFQQLPQEYVTVSSDNQAGCITRASDRLIQKSKSWSKIGIGQNWIGMLEIT